MKAIACVIMGILLNTPISTSATHSARSMIVTQTSKHQRKIVSVETINVQSPVGTVPRLPFQVWVTYTDGTSEYRQTKWGNAVLATEQEQAKYPIGKEYQINGVVTGDNCTANGYPIVANIKVVEGTYATPSNKPIAEPLPLNKVTLNGNNRLTSNRELAIQTILSWDVSQQIYNYRDTYGLSTEGYTMSF